MHVIWRRPDGFHGASPTDFVVVELSGHSRLWLHKHDKDEFPFRVSGGWEENEATKRLNNFANLVGQPKAKWVEYLTSSYNHSMKSDPQEFFTDTLKWLEELQAHLKGDTWEVEILNQAIKTISQRVTETKVDFLKTSSST